MRYLIIFTLLTLGFVQESDAETCNLNSNTVYAEYEIETTLRTDNTTHTSLILVRQGQQVAHYYPQTQITEIWESAKPGIIKKTRYFDAHQRAIEYQPGDISGQAGHTDWSHRVQLISDSLLQHATKTGSQTTDCGIKEHYQYNKNAQISLTWLPQLKLLERFRLKGADREETWTLKTSHTDPEKIAAFFASRDHYLSTDFADIGDDHTDPFLTKMINQGFLEKGASGFYDQHGRALQAENHQH